MVDETVDRHGRLDILINNAGLYASLAMRPFTEIPLEEWRQVMDVNVASMFLTCRAAVPVMREQGGGKIVNISSGTPFRGVPFLLHYVTSKGAIVAFTRALAKELGKDGIHVNCVAPGFTMTRRRQGAPRGGREASRRLGRRADDPARPGARGRRRRGRLPLHAGRRLHHRPDDGDRRRPVLPLILALLSIRTARDRAARTRVVHELDDGDEALVWELLDVEPDDALAGSAGRRAARRLADAPRPGRLPARRDRLPAHASRPGDPRTCCSAADPDRVGRRDARRTAPASGGSRAGRSPCSRPRPTTEETAFVRVLLLPAEWAGKRTIRYVDPADEERPKLQRATSSASTRSRFEPHGGAGILVDQLDRPRRGHGVLRPGRELPPRPRRARATRRSGSITTPPRGGGGEHGRGVREAHRPAGDLPRHARGRARRTPSVGVHTAVPGLDAADPLRRPGAARASRPRGLPGARLPGRVRRDGEVGGDGRATRTGCRSCVARAFHTATRGRPGPVVLALPEDVLSDDEADVADALPLRRPRSRRRADDVDRRRSSCSRRRSGRWSSSAGAGGASRRGRDVIAFAEAERAGRRVVSLPGLRRQRARRCYAGPLTIGMDPKLAQRVEDADVILALGTRLGEIATQRLLAARAAAPAPDARSTSTPTRTSSAASTRPELPIVSGSPEFAAALGAGRSSAAVASWVERAARADYLANLAATAAAGRPRARRGDGLPARAPARRRRAHERRGQLHRLGAPLLRVPPYGTQLAPRAGRDGLRRAGRARREAARTRSGRSSASPATATS